MEPRRITHYTDAATYGGVERVISLLLANRDDAHWRPMLYVHRVPGIQRLAAHALDLGIPCRQIPVLRGSVEQVSQLRKCLMNDRPDAFHAHLNWPLGARFGILAARLARVPYVVATAHLFHPIDGVRWGRAKQWLQAAAIDRYIAVSASVAQCLRENLGVADRKIRVVHNGIEIPAGVSTPKRELRDALLQGRCRKVVLTVARLHAQKGLRDLLDAATRLPDICFVIAGDGPEREQLATLSDSLGLSDRVCWLGHRSDIRDLLAACDLFVLPSINEGLPLSVLEAMSERRPVVATDIPGTNEVVSDNRTGWLAPPGNGAALAARIRSALSDPAQSAIVEAAHELVRTRFSVTAMTRSTEAIYAEDLDRKLRRTGGSK